VAAATAPVTYDAGTKTVALSIGAGLTTSSGSLALAAHKASHSTGGSDALTPADIGASALDHTHSASQVTDFASAVAAAAPPEVLDFQTTAQFPATGSASKIYVATDASRAYQWTGSQYAEIGPAGAYLPVHSHAASDITSGVLATVRLGSGTADATTYLRGDSTFAPAVTNVNGKTGAVLPGTVFEFTRTSAPADATGSGGVYTWTPPANCTMLEILCIGGGGGGGSGRRGAAGSARFGGGGGSGANVTHTTIPRSLISSVLSITVGAGGAGGAAVTADDTSGNNGTSGGLSQMAMAGIAIALGVQGAAGSGGTASTGAGSAPSANGNRTYQGGNGANNGANFGISPFSGAGGGGISAANVAYSGGNAFSSGGGFYFQSATNSTGGAASTTAAGGTGADGRVYGGGGSGGGASANGFNSGAGGNGGDGYIRITVW
jgi:hypothetical protein